MVVDQLRDCENIHLISVGGTYSPKSKAFNGKTTIQSLDNYFVDKTFMSCRTLSMEHGITDSTESFALIRQKLLQRSNAVYLVADHSKFDKTSFIHICNFDKIDAVVTDKDFSDAWRKFLRDENVTIYEC